MSPKFKKFIQNWIINTLAVMVAAFIVPGITYHRLLDLFVASLLLGILNTFLRPILLLLALPLLIFTLGLFFFVINAVLLWFVGSLNQGFQVDGFKAAFLGALIISIVSMVLNFLTGASQSRIEVRRGPGPPNSGRRDDGNDGPVIDV